MRILALDHGTRRIGVAVSDESQTIATPLEYIPAEPPSAALDRLKHILQEKQIHLIIVGMPRNMDGTYGPAAEKVRQFITTIKEQVTTPIRTWDERLTTVQANRYMIQASVRRRDRKQKVDATAAAILLQSYLDATAA
jgi:putative holliday junction resolvase